MDDDAVAQHHRAGAHRARSHPLRSLLLTLVAVGALAALLVWLLLSVDVLGVGDRLLDGAAAPRPQSSDVPFSPPAHPS